MPRPFFWGAEAGLGGIRFCPSSKLLLGNLLKIGAVGFLAPARVAVLRCEMGRYFAGDAAVTGELVGPVE